MTKTETIKILTILSAFYGQGKSDTEIMANAWHVVIGEYEYYIAERAVYNYVRNDTREYASFPSPGNIIDEIEKESKLYNRMFNQVLNAARSILKDRAELYRSYREKIDKSGKKLISADKFVELASMREEDLLDMRDTIIEELKSKDKTMFLEQKG